MFFMYVDESGDVGLNNSMTDHFVLTGLVIHELRWLTYLEQLIDFRQRMRKTFGLKLREEMHASAMISNPGPLVRIKRHDRLTIMRMFADELATMIDMNLVCVVVDKSNKGAGYDVFSNAWRALIQRFENTMSHNNFPGPRNPDERGLLFCDHTDDKKLTDLLRRMRRFNPITNRCEYGPGYRNLTLARVTEDPNFRDSAHSYFIQAADLAAYLLYQQICPNAYMRRKSGQNYFNRMSPIFCTVASRNDARGIVRL